jgi:hypothetical protein
MFLRPRADRELIVDSGEIVDLAYVNAHLGARKTDYTPPTPPSAPEIR